MNEGVERWEANRLFGGFGRPSPLGGVDRAWAPAVDMYQTKDDLVVTAELPRRLRPGRDQRSNPNRRHDSWRR